MREGSEFSLSSSPPAADLRRDAVLPRDPLQTPETALFPLLLAPSELGWVRYEVEHEGSSSVWPAVAFKTWAAKGFEDSDPPSNGSTDLS